VPDGYDGHIAYANPPPSANPPPAARRNVVSLEMSPTRSNIRLARLVASGLGSELGLTVDEIDDLRIAVDEACYWLVSNEVVGLVRVGFDATGERLSICLAADLRGEPTPMPETAHHILDAVTAEWLLHRDGLGLEVQISPRRHRPAPP
jgi:serine/threonine-protein kinase RsbW